MKKEKKIKNPSTKHSNAYCNANSRGELKFRGLQSEENSTVDITMVS